MATEQGARDVAEAELERSIELDGSFVPSLMELAKLYARVPEQRERVGELLARVLELTPEDRIALAQLGRDFLAIGRPDEARAALERMIALPAAPGSKTIARSLEEAIERYEATRPNRAR